MLGLVRRLQAEGRLRRDTRAETLVRAFLSLNVGYLITRHVLAPEQAWDDPKECAALARVFSNGASGR